MSAGCLPCGDGGDGVQVGGVELASCQGCGLGAAGWVGDRVDGHLRPEVELQVAVLQVDQGDGVGQVGDVADPQGGQLRRRGQGGR
jgi:hypothetical protein